MEKKERKGKKVIWFYRVGYYCSEMGGKEILLLMKSKLEIIINYIWYLFLVNYEKDFLLDNFCCMCIV